ncbi:MAG: DnaJ domain-containing protein [Candidatus Melainabacteria bacterium]|nr:DnaJ domain-containing protein [Candidatus Melainabacteria bacterium]
MFSLYAILGLQENASDEAVKAAYKRLCQKLDTSNYETGSVGYLQAAKCLEAVQGAFKTLTNPDLRAAYKDAWSTSWTQGQVQDTQPKLGQLCVASGMITLEELNEAVQSQTTLRLPLGQILQEQRLISQAELDGLLLGQNLVALPADCPHSIGQRLIALGLVSEDMVRIALIEQRTFGKLLGEILVGHGWVDKSVFDALLATD